MSTGPAQEDTVETHEHRASTGREWREVSTGPAQEDSGEMSTGPAHEDSGER